MSSLGLPSTGQIWIFWGKSSKKQEDAQGTGAPDIKEDKKELELFRPEKRRLKRFLSMCILKGGVQNKELDSSQQYPVTGQETMGIK